MPQKNAHVDEEAALKEENITRMFCGAAFREDNIIIASRPRSTLTTNIMMQDGAHHLRAWS